MQKARRDFAKKTAIVTAGAAVAAGTSVLATSGSSDDETKNGVVKGHSNKKEVLYKKTAAWNEYYKNAK